MSVTVRLEGFAELERELERLGREATQKASLRRALKTSAEPMAAIARSLAPNDPATGAPDLANSIAVSTKLSKRQRSQHRRMFRDDRASVEMFVGPGPDPAAWNQEFGNINHRAQPFMRPAWDQDKDAMLDRLKREIWNDIQRTVARAARRAAAQAARGS
ncbi:HK97-gp10 family putative phage morphogenesis protein [Pararhodobacter zhoushanensis]|uniref:HK97 gp10 family phage protein n=1 Tax=Pararhodobacter zhoushanensis TaxID=2479545 RepID=A0ABT3GYH9_9RHOB|nr:HK97-gp10 family putative phage morphogenesis protein [Pararhodobacter zhoushanensis]MCW1932615.1 HK97 gp10 family phage protein [Pararhodobacter zhoushanensis]